MGIRTRAARSQQPGENSEPVETILFPVPNIHDRDGIMKG